MVIQCKNCSRKYRLDDSRIKPPGSSVRCTKCGHIFFVAKKESSENIHKLASSTETPLFEDLKDEIQTEEIATEPQETKELPNAHSDFIQGELRTVQKETEVDEDLLDLPTEHQTNLEDFIDNDTAENSAQNDAQEQPLEEDPDTATQSEPDLLDVSGIEEHFEEKSFEEDSETAESDIMDSTLHEDFNDTTDINLSKSGSGMFAKAIYTLITIAAVIVIFISCVVLLINAQILPKGTLSNITSLVEAFVPLDLGSSGTPTIIISEHKSRWMNTVNGPIYIVSGLITNESTVPVHFVQLKSEYIAAEKKLYEDTFYAGNTFTDIELKGSPIEEILGRLDQKNGDIDVNNSRKLAGLNYNIQPGESIPFFTVFPAERRMLGLKYNLEVIYYKEADVDRP